MLHFEESPETQPRFRIRRSKVRLTVAIYHQDTAILDPTLAYEEGCDGAIFYSLGDVDPKEIDMQLAKAVEALGLTSPPPLMGSMVILDEKKLTGEALSQNFLYKAEVPSLLFDPVTAVRIGSGHQNSFITDYLDAGRPFRIVHPVKVSHISLETIHLPSNIPDTGTVYPVGAIPTIEPL